MREIRADSGTLDSRIVNDINSQVVIISAAIDSLLIDGRYESQLDAAAYDALTKSLRIMSNSSQGIVELLKAPNGKIAHDANNQLAVIIGRAQLLLTNDLYASQLNPADYNDFIQKLRIIETTVQRTVELFQNLGGFYKAKEQGVEVIDASTLGSEETVYRIAHIDDNESIRKVLENTLRKSSNVVNPVMPGVFGHDGKRVRYEVYSYGSVMEALNALPKLGDIDLLVTDREMPAFNGLHLLYAISQLPNARVREPRYANVKNVAMLTAGITLEQAEGVTKTYGATVIDKDKLSKPLALEQQIYSAINQKAA